MAESSSGDKTEDPTPKRIKDSREKGQIPRSNDFGAWFGVLALMGLIPFTLSNAYRYLSDSFQDVISIGEQGTLSMATFFGQTVLKALLIAGPVILILGLINVAAQFAQVRWTPKKMKPEWSKLNAIAGIKNMFKPKRMMWETLKNIMKVTAVIYMCYGPMVNMYNQIVGRGTGVGFSGLIFIVGATVQEMLTNMIIVGLIIAGIDYLMSRKQIMDQIKMTKQEIKEEYKQMEGDPHVRAQRKQRQMQMSQNRMMAAAADASVMVVNPTHYAVGVAYDPTSGAPRVVAKGIGPLALKLREVAQEKDIPIVHDVPLARTLYRVVEVDEQIPVELYEPLAKVLAWIWNMKARGRATDYIESPYADKHVDLMHYQRVRRRAKRGEARQATVERTAKPASMVD